MDGRVLEEAFAPAYRAARPVVRTEALPTGGPAREAGQVFSPEDEEEIRQRLAGLGYLS
jgi:hypothetical protein